MKTRPDWPKIRAALRADKRGLCFGEFYDNTTGMMCANGALAQASGIRGVTASAAQAEGCSYYNSWWKKVAAKYRLTCSDLSYIAASNNNEEDPLHRAQAVLTALRARYGLPRKRVR